TLNNSKFASFTETACSSYTWVSNGITYWNSGIYVDTVLSSTGCDSVNTLNLTINSGDTNNFTVMACDNFYWSVSGMTYTQGGQYSQLFTNQNGCDSLEQLDLTIHNSSVTTISVNACDSYTSPSGTHTWNTTGVYLDTLFTSFGCDSVITINLTINNTQLVSITESVCSSYTWASNGVTYWNSGQYVDTVTSSTGCDSINTLNLTINSGDTNSLVATSCDSYFWSVTGINYMQSGQYSQLFTNQHGCDSLEQLDLTINSPDSVGISILSCGPYFWAATGLTYSSSGTYSTTLTNVGGCDSLVTLNLAMNQPYDTTLTIMACDEYIWNQNGNTYTNSGLFSDTTQGVNGCDSIVNLDLTILESSSEIITENACGYYSSPDGMVYDSTGQYQAIVPNSVGCDSVITINLQVTKTETNVTQVADVLYAFSSPSYQYQWIECVSNNPIVGATDSIFSPTVNGSYAVEITHQNCFETSPCINVTNVGVAELEETKINIYPNPAQNHFSIHVNGYDKVEIILTDATGKYVHQISATSGENDVDCSGFKPGLYLAYITAENTHRVVKLIIK
ncbi:MAG: T9SS type A sorting domain-containing protein, partial [Salibacteraceae bacterium]